jgi:hypothetical protein
MGSTLKLQQFFWILLEQLPSLITILGCIVFVLTRRKKYPKVALLALISLVLIFLDGPFFTAIFLWVPDLLLNRDSLNAQTIHTFYLVLGLIVYTAFAISFAPLLAAIFIQRGQARSN